MVAPKIRIGERWVGDGQPCFVIAEAGANHNRDLGMGKALIDVAAEAGADAVKFQTYSAETLYSKHTPRFSYLEGVSDQDTWDLIKAIELPREWQADSGGARARRAASRSCRRPSTTARWTSSRRSACPRTRSPRSRSSTCR